MSEAVTLHGEVVARAQRLPGGPPQVRTALRRVSLDVLRGLGSARLAVVSAAEPVDRSTGRLVQLPDLPFLVGSLDPVRELADRVAGPIVVDNDVNWAARTERRHGQLDDFVYLYLGVGAGAAVVGDGEVVRGHAGLAGEIMHVLTVGPGGRAMPLTQVFAELGLHRPGSTAMDVPRLLAALSSDAPELEVIVAAVAGVVPAAVALADPEVVVLGGPWGAHETLVRLVAERVAAMPRPVPVRRAAVDAEPALTGARAAAVDLVRTSLTDQVRP